MKKLSIECFNPYEAKFPNRRVVSRGQLHLYKTLISNGIECEIIPDDGSKLNYLAQKDITSLLSDPFIITIGTIGVNILSNAIWDFIKGLGEDKKSNIFFKDKDGKVFNYQGNQLKDSTVVELVSLLNDKQSGFNKSFQIASSQPDLSIPIHLEHKPEIVGWCHVSMKDDGLFVDKAEIFCDNTLSRIDKGELKGFSIGGLVTKSTCQICSQDYVDCPHIAGEVYNQVKCTNLIEKCDLAEISVVKDPANPICNIQKRN